MALSDVVHETVLMKHFADTQFTLASAVCTCSTQLCGLKFAHLNLHSDRNPHIFTNCMLRWGLFSVSTRCNRQFANCLQYRPASFVSLVKLNSCVELAGCEFCRCLLKCRGSNCSYYWVSRYRNKEMFYTLHLINLVLCLCIELVLFILLIMQ